MNDSIVESSATEKDNSNGFILGEKEPSQADYQLSFDPSFGIEPIPIPVPQSVVMFVPPPPVQLDENELILKAKKELFMIKAGHKRKMEKEFQFETPQKKRMRRCSSGPPSVETSPLTPTRKEKVRNIRHILFARNLNQALEDAVSLDLNNQQEVVSSEDQNGHVEKLENNQWVEVRNDFFVEMGKERNRLKNDEAVEVHDRQESLLQNEQLDASNNDQFVDLSSIQIDNDTLMDLMKESPPCDWSLSLDEGGKKLLQNMITYVCEDGETTICVTDIGVQNTLEALKDNVVVQEEIQNDDDESNAEEGVSSNSNERFYRNPRTGKADTVWFEKPALSTTYHDVLSDRDRFRYLIFKVTKGIKGSSANRSSVTKTIKKILTELGYSRQQINGCFGLTRAMYYRFNNLSMDKCVEQFKDILEDVEFVRKFNETVGVVLNEMI